MAWRCTRRRHIFSVAGIISTCFLLIFASPLNLNAGGENSLYGPDDKVFILNAGSIKKEIFESDRAWFVEYFSSWCGHCIHFAPKYKKFAEDLWDWRNVVMVAGIDCADENNTATCREFEVMGYPTLRLYGPNSPPLVEASEREKERGIEKSLNKGVGVEKSESMSKLKKSLIDELDNHFPNLLSYSKYSGSDVNELWSDKELHFNVKATSVVVIFESEGGYVGKEIVLRLSLYKFIKVYRFAQKNEIYSQLKLDSWPAAGYIGQGGVMERIELGSSNIVHAVCNSTLKLANIQRKEELALPDLKQDQIPMKKSADGVSVRTNEDIISMDDLLHALRDALHKEIALVKIIQGSKLQALNRFLHAVNNYFPFDRRETRIFVEDLSNWVDSRNEIESSDFLGKLEHLQDTMHPWDIDLKQWDGCRGTIPGRRGYTCGLWRLFHTLTLIAVQKNSKDNVLEAVYGYVKEFFGCSECREHFAGMVTRDKIFSEDSVVTQALWLWKAHNEVNLRVKGSLSEDPGYPKDKYPNKHLCPECYESTGNFDEGKVLDYLLKVYSHPKRSQEHNVAEVDKILRGPNPKFRLAGSEIPMNLIMSGEVQSNKSHRWLGFFSIADIGLFMIVYISVACLLLLGYVHFKVVGRRWCNPNFLLRKVFVQSVV